jgi:hypothetical protein
MTNYMGSTIFLLAVCALGTVTSTAINLVLKSGFLSIQKANNIRNTSYYIPIINNDTSVLSSCSLEGSVLKSRK